MKAYLELMTRRSERNIGLQILNGVGCSSLAISSSCSSRNIQLAARQSSAPKPSTVLNIVNKLSQQVGTCLVPRLVGIISRNSISQNSKLSYNSSRSLADLYSAVHGAASFSLNDVRT